MQIFSWIFTGACAYLLGSVPFGLLIAKSRGVDIRAVGSGNIGASNVFRSVGKSAGAATFALDACKGFFAAFVLPMLATRFLAGAETGADTMQGLTQLRVFAGACAVAGHNWSCLLRFKGGKGVATSLGFLIGLTPAAALLALAAWAATMLASRYASLASIVAAATLGVSVWFLDAQPRWLHAVVALLALVAVIKHRSNIRRLLNGTENRFSFSRKKE